MHVNPRKTFQSHGRTGQWTVGVILSVLLVLLFSAKMMETACLDHETVSIGKIATFHVSVLAILRPCVLSGHHG